MKKINNKSLIFVGDIHGDFNFLHEACSNIENALIIQVGDCGLGFHLFEREKQNLNFINETCVKNNNTLALLFGNHDSKKRFSEFRQLTNEFKNIIFLDDYEIIDWNNKLIQFVGGAISIDRTQRREGISYWSDEGVVFNKDKCKKVDILVTHTAPSFCFPQKFNELVYGWAREDAYLIEDLNDERYIMNEIFKLCQPSFHIYGHFHSSWVEEINGCKHRLLDINEILEYYEN
jgi:predicted phosphodiesterase